MKKAGLWNQWGLRSPVPTAMARRMKWKVVAVVGEGEVVAHRPEAHRRGEQQHAGQREAREASGPLRASGRMEEASGAVDAEHGAHPHPFEVDLPAEGEPPEVVEGDARRALAVVLGLAETVADPAQVPPQGGVAEAREADPGLAPVPPGEDAAAPAERAVFVRLAQAVQVERGLPSRREIEADDAAADRGEERARRSSTWPSWIPSSVPTSNGGRPLAPSRGTASR